MASRNGAAATFQDGLREVSYAAARVLNRANEPAAAVFAARKAD